MNVRSRNGSASAPTRSGVLQNEEQGLVETTTFFVPTPDGWHLGLKRVVHRGRLVAGAPSVLLLPGYGMNSFLFGFSPHGVSLERSLAEAGREVWSVDLRGQGASRRYRSDAPAPSLSGYMARDVPAAVAHALEHALGGARSVVLLWCSLGGTIAYGATACGPSLPVGGVIAVGSPLSWASLPGPLRAVGGRLGGLGGLRVRGTRRLARTVFPVLLDVPGAVSLYVNHANVDRAAIRALVQTIEDPEPAVNRDIAAWIASGRLLVNGVDVASALSRVASPLLIVTANRDGIVPEATAVSAADMWGGPVERLEGGTARDWYAHADLFIGARAPDDVFAPIVEWLGRSLPA